MGSDGFLIGVRLGHTQSSVTGIYAHVSLASQLVAAEKAEGYFPAALSTHRTELSTQTTNAGAVETPALAVNSH